MRAIREKVDPPVVHVVWQQVVVAVVDFFFPYNKNWTALPKLNRRRILFTGYKADVV